MVPIEELSPGVCVKIVDHWVGGCHHNSSGYMDKYLGQTVTVYKNEGGYVLIEEDIGDCSPYKDGRWHWFPNAFERIVSGVEYEDFEPASNSEILSLFRK